MLNILFKKKVQGYLKARNFKKKRKKLGKWGFRRNLTKFDILVFLVKNFMNTKNFLKVFLQINKIIYQLFFFEYELSFLNKLKCFL